MSDGFRWSLASSPPLPSSTPRNSRVALGAELAGYEKEGALPGAEEEQKRAQGRGLGSAAGLGWEPVRKERLHVETTNYG